MAIALATLAAGTILADVLAVFALNNNYTVDGTTPGIAGKLAALNAEIDAVAGLVHQLSLGIYVVLGVICVALLGRWAFSLVVGTSA